MYITMAVTKTYFFLFCILFANVHVTFAKDVVVDQNEGDAKNGRLLLFEDALTGYINDLIWPFYKAMLFFLDTVLQRPDFAALTERLPDGKWPNFGQGFDPAQWFIEDGNMWEFIFHYMGYIVCICLSVLFLIFIPIVGCCFCCCRCCGNCGGKVHPKDGSGAKCGRVCCGFFFLLFVCAALASVVVMFPAAVLIRNEVPGGLAVQTIKQSMEGVQDYAGKFIQDAKYSVLTNFDEARNESYSILDGIPSNTFEQVGDYTGARDTLIEMATYLDGTEDNLQVMNTALDVLKSDSISLDSKLTDLRNDLQGICSHINVTQCNNIATALTREANFSGITDFEAQILAVNASSSALQVGIDSYDSIEESVKTETENNIIKVKDQVNDAYHQVETALNDLEKQINQFNLTGIYNTIDDVQIKYISVYGKYAFYGLLGFCCLTALVVFFYLIGLVCGCVGSRAGKQDCCNKGKASCCIMCSTYLYLILLVFILLILFIFFVIGAMLHTEVCRYFAHPETYDKSLHSIENLAYQYAGDLNISIVEALANCDKNQAAYTAVQLENINGMNITELLDLNRYGIPEQIERLTNITIDFSSIVLLHNETVAALVVLNTSLVSIPYTNIKTETAKNITIGDLKDIETYLNWEAEQATGSLQISLEHLAGNVSELRNGIVKDMHAAKDLLEKNAKEMHSSLLERYIENFMANLSLSEDRIQQNASTIIKEHVVDNAEDILDILTNTTKELDYDVRNNIGKCGALYDDIMSILTVVCTRFLYPFNMIWFSNGWAFAFLFIGMFFGCKLSSLFRKREGYDSVKQTYAGDSIPLQDMAPPPDYEFAVGQVNYAYAQGQPPQGYAIPRPSVAYKPTPARPYQQDNPKADKMAQPNSGYQTKNGKG